MEHRLAKKQTMHMANTNKKMKPNLSKSDSENETIGFVRFILQESSAEICLVRSP